MNWTWTLPWYDVENLLGVLTGDNIEIYHEDSGETYIGSLVSIGVLIGRLDILFNVRKKEE
jgi:hypothetical protein